MRFSLETASGVKKRRDLLFNSFRSVRLPQGGRLLFTEDDASDVDN